MMRVHASPSLNKRAEAIGVKLKADDPSPIPSTMLSLPGRDEQCGDEPTPRWKQGRRRSKVSTEQHGAGHGRPDPEGEHVRHHQTEQDNQDNDDNPGTAPSDRATTRPSRRWSTTWTASHLLPKRASKRQDSRCWRLQSPRLG